VDRREKEQVVSELHRKLQELRAVILTDYRGLDVEEITRLRRQLQEVSAEYRVVKNTLMRLASKETSLEQLSDLLVGPTAMAFSNTDPLAPARVLLEFSKEMPALEIKGGLVEGRVVGPHEIEAMAKLPGREVLLGNLLRLLKGGQVHLVNVFSAHIRKLVQVLEAIRVTRQGEEKAKAEVEDEKKVKVEAEDEKKVEVEAEVEEVVKEEGEREEAKAEVEDEKKVKAEVEEVVKEEGEKEKAKAEEEAKEAAEEKAEVEAKEEGEEKAKAEVEAEEEVKEEPKKGEA